MSTFGRVELATVTVIDDVSVWPAVSVAVAEMVWGPSATAVELHDPVHPFVPLLSVSNAVPSTAKTTLNTPWSSVALAEKVTTPRTVAPVAGLVRVTSGGASTGTASVQLAAAQLAAASNIARPSAVSAVGPLV